MTPITTPPGALSRGYDRLLLAHPRLVLVVLLLGAAFFAYHSQDFRLDASADSLLLEADADLQFYRQVGARYQTQEQLVVTFSTSGDLFSDEALLVLTRLRDELRAIPHVASVISILDAPLVTVAGVALADVSAETILHLETPTVDRQLARAELTDSPVYKDLIISRDHRTTAILLDLERDDRYRDLQAARNELLIARGSGELDSDQTQRLTDVSLAYAEAREVLDARNHTTIEQARSVIDRYQQHGALHLGGVPMISDDMVQFVRSDLIVFGTSVLFFLTFVLALIFRRVRWVVLPLASCFYASVVMIGMLGWVGWEVTVISSNFLALMLIITISMNIHLAVRYAQLVRDRPDESQLQLVSLTVRRMVRPCLYTALTTIMGFCSLAFSDIKPVRDFGWMMSIGLAVAFLTSFTLFPVLLVQLRKKGFRESRRKEVPLTELLAGLTERHGRAILAIAGVFAVFSGVGISRLTVENSFIDYFREETEIYRGMKLIDDKLGGTTPLDILVNFNPDRDFVETDGVGGVDEEEKDWDLGGDAEEERAYWFTPYKVERIKQVHDFLEAQPEVGKVLSLASLIRVAEGLNDGEELDAVELSLLYKKLPDEIKEPLIGPYVSIEHDEARIQLRILDSMKGLRRARLLERVQTGLREELEFDEREVKLTGTLVLYNNMLQSLVSSQINSLGAVMAGITLMFLALFRSLRLAIIGIVPNLLAAAIVLGLMGWAEIPLDVMTITIAAISIGIAVDNGIHYIYRFREEFAQSGDYVETLRICHANIGMAVFYTSTTVIFGFSILILSNFLPTIYFGVLTGLAMLIAFVAALTLLPRLILEWKPFG